MCIISTNSSLFKLSIKLRTLSLLTTNSHKAFNHFYLFPRGHGGYITECRVHVLWPIELLHFPQLFNHFAHLSPRKPIVSRLSYSCTSPIDLSKPYNRPELGQFPKWTNPCALTRTFSWPPPVRECLPERQKIDDDNCDINVSFEALFCDSVAALVMIWIQHSWLTKGCDRYKHKAVSTELKTLGEKKSKTKGFLLFCELNSFISNCSALLTLLTVPYVPVLH